jgi:hypothetical protein
VFVVSVVHTCRNANDFIGFTLHFRDILSILDQVCEKLVQAKQAGRQPSEVKRWLPYGTGPMLDPFAIEAGIQVITSWSPVSTDVWGACQVQAMTTCVTVGGVGEILEYPIRAL